MTDIHVSAAGMRLIELLVGNPPQSMDDMIEAAGVTRTAVTEQLNELVAAGFVRRSMERLPGRGRPRYLYAASDTAMSELFPGIQSLLVPAMWRAIEDIGGKKLKGQILRRVSRDLADHYKRQLHGKTPEQRLRELADLLRASGRNLVEIETDDSGRLTLHRRNCSFFSMFEESRAVCQIDEKMLSSIVGTTVRRTACRHDGAPCCVFEIVEKK